MSSCNLFLCVSHCQKHVHCPASLCFSALPLAADLPRGSRAVAEVVRTLLLPLSPSEMSCTIEKALADAKALVERLREHDSAAEALIEQTTALNKRVEAMKQVCSSPALLALGMTALTASVLLGSTQ